MVNCALGNAKAKLFTPGFPTKHLPYHINQLFSNHMCIRTDTTKHKLANIKCLTDIFYAINTDFIVI